MRSILLGAVVIVVLGVVDDIMALPAMLKFVVQIVAALIPAAERGPDSGLFQSQHFLQ